MRSPMVLMFVFIMCDVKGLKGEGVTEFGKLFRGPAFRVGDALVPADREPIFAVLGCHREDTAEAVRVLNHFDCDVGVFNLDAHCV